MISPKNNFEFFQNLDKNHSIKILASPKALKFNKEQNEHNLIKNPEDFINSIDNLQKYYKELENTLIYLLSEKKGENSNLFKLIERKNEISNLINSLKKFMEDFSEKTMKNIENLNNKKSQEINVKNEKFFGNFIIFQ